MARRQSISTRKRSKTKRTETSAPTKRTTRFVNSGRAPQKKVPQKKAPRGPNPPQVRHPEEVTWKDLATDNEVRSSAGSRASTMIGGVSTVRFVAGVLAVLVLVTLYVGHVNATRDLAQDVQALRRERLELQLELNRVSGDYERITGHTQIAGRARDLGLQEAVPQGRPITVN